jgi:D-alanyl-D-alanine endopeptidase (penicillin-binding protein 7)
MLKNIFLIFALFVNTAFAHNITATNWLVADGNGHVIDSVNPDQPRSIASITKLMTAMVVLDTHSDMDAMLGKLTRRQLLELMLVRSDNHAAETLCENYPGGRSNCINAMNMKARSMGLQDTHYADASGLNIMNISTANELLKIVMEARKYPEIVQASHVDHDQFVEHRHVIRFHNTNPLVAHSDFIVSKTGYTHAAGGCIVIMAETKIGQRIIVLLNSKNVKTRIPEASYLMASY